ncbi:MAG: YCF48-related protein [Sinobacteraceae bacterium]|nr:YCF48-related protein [Nevskiaceae bacterium]
MRIGGKVGIFCGLALLVPSIVCVAVAQTPSGGMPPGVAGTQPAAGGAPAGTAPAGAAPAGAAPAAGGLPPGIAPSSSPGKKPSKTTQPAAAPAAKQQPSEPWSAPAAVYEQVVRQPQPAFMVPLAGKRLMLDVTRAGKRLVAVGAHGVIVTSDDDGKTWVQSESPVRELLTAVSFANAKDGWAVGHDATIVGSRDGGKSWQVQHFDPKAQAPLLNLHVLDARHVFAFGAFGALLQTGDAGQTWTPVDADTIRLDQLNFYAAAKLGDGTLVLAGERGLVDVSVDNGVSWQKLNSPWDGSFFGVLPVGNKGALLFGLRGHVYISDDINNDPWRQVLTQTTASFYGGAVLPDGRFVLVGTAGMIMLISPDGASVQRVEGPSSQDYDAVLPIAGHLILAGKRGMQQTKLPQ